MESLRDLISSHAHVLSHGILNNNVLSSNGQLPMNAITFTERLGSTNISLYFNIEWYIFNSAPPFTTQTNTYKLAASTSCILSVAHFVDTPLAYA